MKALEEIIWESDDGIEEIGDVSNSIGGMNDSPIPCMTNSCGSGGCGSWNVFISIGYPCSYN